MLTQTAEIGPFKYCHMWLCNENNITLNIPTEKYSLEQDKCHLQLLITNIIVMTLPTPLNPHPTNIFYIQILPTGVQTDPIYYLGLNMIVEL